MANEKSEKSLGRSGGRSWEWGQDGDTACGKAPGQQRGGGWTLPRSHPPGLRTQTLATPRGLSTHVLVLLNKNIDRGAWVAQRLSVCLWLRA